MSYAAGSKVVVAEYGFPAGFDQLMKNRIIRGSAVVSGTDYVPGGIGSSYCEVTAVSTAGVATYSNLLGFPLQNGQIMTLFGLTHNSGLYTISAVTPASATAGTFQLASIFSGGAFGPITFPLTADTAETANGTGQLFWGNGQCPDLGSSLPPFEANFFSNSGSGLIYQFNQNSQLLQVFTDSGSAGDALAELGAASLIANTLPAGDSIQFNATFSRA